MVVQALMAEHGMNERRSCQVGGNANSTQRYWHVARLRVHAFIQTHRAPNQRHCVGLLCDSARHHGKPWVSVASTPS